MTKAMDRSAAIGGREYRAISYERFCSAARYNGRVQNVEVYFEADTLLGESPVWDDRLNEFQWVDIKRGEIHRLSESSQRHIVLDLKQSIGAIAPTVAGDSWVAGLRDGVAEIGFDGNIRRHVAIDADRPTHRMNDGKCDARGRFWTGTLNEEVGPASDALYRVADDFTFQLAVRDVGLSNGLGWSPDNRTMYRVDSTAGLVFRSDFDAESGSIRNESVHVTVRSEEGEPDGLAVDVDGCIWIAIWDGGCVRRYTPSGQLDVSVSLPAARPTSCAFGGASRDALLVTSASGEGKPRDKGGDIFAIAPGVGGLPVARFGPQP